MNRLSYGQVIEKFEKLRPERLSKLSNNIDVLFDCLIKAIVDSINESCDIVEDVQNHIKKGIEYHLEKGDLKPMDEQ